MGIYDREYYRGETRGSGWLTGLAPATKVIILANVVIFTSTVVLTSPTTNLASSVAFTPTFNATPSSVTV